MSRPADFSTKIIVEEKGPFVHAMPYRTGPYAEPTPLKYEIHTDEFGRFTAAPVREPVSRILNKPRDIPDFNRHLTAFCSAKRGAILEREGNPQNYIINFAIR